MDNIIVYLDDANYALQMLQPMLPADPSTAGRPTRWLLVGCAPRVTQHVSRFVTHSARDSWRRKWSDKVFGQIVPALRRDGDDVITLIAQSSLGDQTDALVRQHGAARVLDARRPRLGHDPQPVTTPQTPPRNGAAGYMAAMAGMGLLFSIE